MTPKQRKAKAAYERERRRLHRLHRFEEAARARVFASSAASTKLDVARWPARWLRPAWSRRNRCLSAASTTPSRCGPSFESRSRRSVKLRAVAWAIGSACVAEIDRLNIYWASVLAMERAIASLAAVPEYLITDAVRIRSFAGPQEPLIHGDARCALVAAASIIAKVHRDGLMVELDLVDSRTAMRFIRDTRRPIIWRRCAVHGPSIHHRANWARVRDAQLALDPNWIEE